MEKTRTVIRIAGKEYTITSEESQEYVRRVAQDVDRKMAELALATHLPPGQLAVLTAVNATDEMMKARDEARVLRMRLDRAEAELANARAAEGEHEGA